MKRLLLLTAAIPLLALHVSAFAQPSKKQQGEIGTIDLKDKEDENTYKKVEARVIKKMDALVQNTALLSEGTVNKQKDFDKFELNYIAASYLFCTLKTGACPFVLEALLELDLANSIAQNTVACPNLKQFWKLWISNDMEKRVSFGLGVGQFSKAQKFKKELRPKFIKCEATITNIKKTVEDKSRFYIQRYGESSPEKKAIKKARSLMKTVQKKIPNIFYKTKVKG